jgi:hypothetical protein
MSSRADGQRGELRAGRQGGAAPRRAASGGARRGLGWVGLLAAALLAGGGSVASAATLGNAIDRDARVTVSIGASADGIKATAVSGDTLYLSNVGSIGLRASGLAVVDAGRGALERAFPEIDGAQSDEQGSARTVVPDGAGGAYLVGVAGAGLDGVRQIGVVHVLQDGSVDADFRPLLERAVGGGSERTDDVRDLAVGPDGTVYVAGGFDHVDGQPRPGVAALDGTTGAVLDWAPELQGPAPIVDAIALAGGQLLLAGSFTGVRTGARDGLAGLSLADAAPTAWKPAGLDAEDAGTELLARGDTAYLVGGDVQAVGTTGAGAVTDLALDPDGVVTDAAIAGDSLYLVGNFSQLDGASRSGLAQVALPAGTVTSWNPGAAGAVRGSALAVDAERVYVAGAQSLTAEGTAWGGVTRCGGAAVARGDGAVTPWNPRFSTGGCAPPSALAASGGRVWAVGVDSANVAKRDGLAAVDVADDAILPWAPELDGAVGPNDMAVSPDGRTLYAVGDLSEVNGQPRSFAFAVAADPTATADTAAAVRSWDPAPDGPATMLALGLSGDGETVERVYLGGFFSAAGGASSLFLAAVRASDGSAVAGWAPAPDGPVADLAVADDGTLYVGGGFTSIGRTPQARNGLAAFASGSDTPTAWDPAMGSGIGAVLDLAVTDERVYVAGAFDGAIGGATRRGVAAVRRADGSAVSGWDPAPNGPVAAVTVGADGDVYLLGGDAGGGDRFTAVDGSPRPTGLASVTADGTLTQWAPQQGGAFGPTLYSASPELQTVGGRLVVPGATYAAIDGLAQRSLLAFAAAVAPQVIYPPAIAGTAREGRSLLCEPGVYGRDSYALAYEWLRDGTPVAGATGTRYVVQAADRGHELACRETATNALGSARGTSEARRVAVDRPSNDEPPEVAGTVRVGVAATCTRGRWSDFPTGHRYQWLLDGAAIAGATSSTYVPAAGQENHVLACEVVAENAAGESAPARSQAKAIAPAQSGPPPCVVNCGPPGGNPPGGNPPGGNPPGGNPPGNPPGTPPPGGKPAGSVKAGRATVGRGGRIVLPLTLSDPGTVTVTLTARVGRRQVLLGRASARVKRGGRVTLQVKLSAAGRRALAKRTKVTIAVVLAPSNGKQRASASATATLRVAPARRAARKRR